MINKNYKILNEGLPNWLRNKFEGSGHTFWTKDDRQRAREFVNDINSNVSGNILDIKDKESFLNSLATNLKGREDLQHIAKYYTSDFYISDPITALANGIANGDLKKRYGDAGEKLAYDLLAYNMKRYPDDAVSYFEDHPDQTKFFARNGWNFTPEIIDRIIDDRNYLQKGLVPGEANFYSLKDSKDPKVQEIYSTIKGSGLSLSPHNITTIKDPNYIKRIIDLQKKYGNDYTIDRNVRKILDDQVAFLASSNPDIFESLKISPQEIIKLKKESERITSELDTANNSIKDLRRQIDNGNAEAEVKLKEFESKKQELESKLSEIGKAKENALAQADTARRERDIALTRASTAEGERDIAVAKNENLMRDAYNTQLEAFKKTRNYQQNGDASIPDSLKNYENFKNTIENDNGITINNFGEKVVTDSGRLPVSTEALIDAFHNGKTIEYVKNVMGQAYEQNPGTIITAGALGTLLLAAGGYGVYRLWKKYRERKKGETESIASV